MATNETKNGMSDKDWLKVDPGIEYIGKRITLPESPEKMPLRVAAAALLRKAKDEEEEMDVHEIIDAYPLDAIVALNRAMHSIYGWTSVRATPTFFGPRKPTIFTVKTGPNPDDFEQVPVGQFNLPNVENPVYIHMENGRDNDLRRPHAILYGTVKKRERGTLQEIAALAREYLKSHSIYRGKAFRMQTNDGQLAVERAPEFFPISHIKPDELILNDEEFHQINSSLWTPIQHTSECVEHDIPLRRGVLLEGTYGTGKSLTAAVTSRLCVENGWTFILVDDVRALANVLEFAQRYQPAVVFAEDVDRVVSVRDQRGNDILNTIDGVLSKDAKVITVLTTNHVEKLEKAMLRPGRLDAVISIRPPQESAVMRLIHMYARDLLAHDEDLSEVAVLLKDNIPAVIREVVERSKLSMIARSDETINASDLKLTAIGMKRHLELLANRAPEPSASEKLGTALVEVMSSKMALNGSGNLVEGLSKVAKQVEFTHQWIARH